MSNGFKEKVTGKLKEVAGNVTGDKELKGEGLADQAAGKAKEVLDDTKDVLSDTADTVKGAFKGVKEAAEDAVSSVKNFIGKDKK